MSHRSKVEAEALREQQALRDARKAELEARAAKAYAETDPALSDAEIAERLGVSSTWVREWRRRRGLKAHSPYIAADPRKTLAVNRTRAKRKALAEALRAKYGP